MSHDWGEMSRRERLEFVREKVAGMRTLTDFHRRLSERAEHSFSYDAVRTYHVQGREPPADYLQLVAEVFRVDPAWLLAGQGEPRAGMAASDVSRVARILDASAVQFTDAVMAKVEVHLPHLKRTPPWAPLLAELHLRFGLSAGPIAAAIDAALVACGAGPVRDHAELDGYLSAVVPSLYATALLAQQHRSHPGGDPPTEEATQ